MKYLTEDGMNSMFRMSPRVLIDIVEKFVCPGPIIVMYENIYKPCCETFGYQLIDTLANKLKEETK